MRCGFAAGCEARLRRAVDFRIWWGGHRPNQGRSPTTPGELDDARQSRASHPAA